MQTTQAQDGTAIADWTFMIYMSGDSTLSSNVPDDLDEMKDVGSNDQLNIIVLMDMAGAFDTQLLRIMESDSESFALSSVNASWGNELNLGRSQTLVDFVLWTVGNYPAEHYALDLWGHGIGWAGVCPDKNDFLEPAEVRSAMSSISNAGIRMDIVIIDACQMGMLETVYELRSAADYALVSEKDVPLNGLPYTEVLTILADNPQIGTEDFGRGIADAYVDWGLVHSRYSLTLSLIDLSYMDELATALDAYSDEAIKTVGYLNREIIMARMATEEYDGTYEYDLWHLLQNINAHTRYKRLETLSAEVLSSLGSCVAYERHWTSAIDEPADNAHGLSIYFPTHGAGLSYQDTTLGQDTAWDEFLAAMTPYFSNPGSIEEHLETSAGSVDTDADELNDLFEFSAHSSTGQFEMEVYGPNGNVAYEYASNNSGWHNLTYSPGALGGYSAAFYLWEGGSLVNYSLIESGLNKEGWSRISGRVTSNIGRGLKWTRIVLYEADGVVIGSTVTEFDGRYTLSIKVPTETEGVNLTLSCGLGSRRQDATLAQLFSENSHDFELETSHVSVLWLTYATVAVNVLALAILMFWLIGRKGSGDDPDKHEDKGL